MPIAVVSSAGRTIRDDREISRSADAKTGQSADDSRERAPYGRGRPLTEGARRMNERTQDRLLALCGIASVVVELVGTFIAMGSGKTHSLTWTSSTASIADAFSNTATTTVWVGAYLEMLSVGLFLAFAIWACAKLGGGVLGAIGQGAAIASVAVTCVSLGLLSTAAYLAGRSLDISAARALVTATGATYVTTWFLTSFFLLAVGSLALVAGRRIVGWSAIAIAAFWLVATGADPSNLGQLSGLLALIWIAGTSIALARGERTPARADVAAQHA
jgi:hypothetical protein